MWPMESKEASRYFHGKLWSIRQVRVLGNEVSRPTFGVAHQGPPDSPIIHDEVRVFFRIPAQDHGFPCGAFVGIRDPALQAFGKRRGVLQFLAECDDPLEVRYQVHGITSNPHRSSSSPDHFPGPLNWSTMVSSVNAS